MIISKNPFFPRHAFLFKGGGGGGGVPRPAEAPPPVPPVTERSSEVAAASRQSRQDSQRRKGLRATLLAGETGGFGPKQEMRKSLLGR